MLGACCLRKPRQRHPSEPRHYSQYEYNITSVNRTLLGDDNLIMEDEVWYSDAGLPHRELQDLKESPKQTNCTTDLDFTYTCDYLTHTQCQALANQQPEQTQVVSFSPGARCSDVGCGGGGGCGCFSQLKLWRSSQSDGQGCEDCTCTQSGKVDCVCRHLIHRKEIRDLTLRERRLYQRAIRKLYARSAVWKGFALLRAEFSPQAGHHAFFLPWHRYFLRLVEHELQSVSSCRMAVPYFEWTVDSGSMQSSAAWQAGLFGGDGEPETGCVPHHPFQGSTPHFYWKPCLRRSFNSSVWLPDAVTLHKTINQADFQVFSQSLQTFSGLFRLWVGGHMASPLAAYDPLYLSHIAFMDKLWEQWQEKHQLASKRETSSHHQAARQLHVTMKPFDIHSDDVIFSQQQSCIVYVPITIGAPCNITSFQTHPQSNPKFQEHSINKSASHSGAHFDQYGYDRDGYDRSGWDRWGFSKDGFNLDSIDREGYDMSGFNRYGFNRSNVSWFGVHRDTVAEKKWMKEHDEEYSDAKTHKDKVISEIFRDNGYNIYGFDPLGLDHSGFDAFGFQTDGYDKDGCNWFFNGPHYLRIYFHVQQQLLSSSDDILAHITRTCPPITSLPRHWATWDWMTFARDCQPDQNWAGPETDNMVKTETQNKSRIWLPVTPDHRFCFKLHWYSGCPLGSAPFTCPDLCRDARCHGYPQAVCHMHNCGSCFIEWRDPATGNHLICHDW
ncbi:uncharacterized protein LOC115392201 [Salarias fasciatus]|uniref:uncharacterized protein LOC115392201 n=1 Tax=Salarias fasciatus TaxID=181472 RepID=UPI001176AE56|nr:uncharacterized protein LOC115392201 [Salarias fasciatus]